MAATATAVAVAGVAASAVADAILFTGRHRFGGQRPRGDGATAAAISGGQATAEPGGVRPHARVSTNEGTPFQSRPH